MENIRVDSLLGSKKVIVGNPHSDLILETLGKVYIKSGRNCKLLDDVIKELAVISEKPQEEVYAKTIIVNSLDELQSLDYPGDGYLIYNSLSKSLYISYEEKYVALIESITEEGDSYVKKSGDIMTGPLELTVTAQAPLIVHSKRLINNLNANYLQGYSGEEFAKKKENEIISGDWTFTGQNISRANWRFYRNIILDGSISSPFFASGFSGSGWMMDAKTNTLTVDYLVVRKAMQVYEMVVNKISATNGSLWVSNASKISDYRQLTQIASTEFVGDFSTAYIKATGKDFTVLDDIARSILSSMLQGMANITFTDKSDFITSAVIEEGSISVSSKMLHIVDAKALVNSKLFTSIDLLWNLEFIEKINKDFVEVPDESGVLKPTGSPVAGWSDEDFGLIHLSAQITDFFPPGDELLGATMVTVSEDNKKLEYKKLYLDYFRGVENIFIIDFDKDEYPVFKRGDIVRCQKYDNQLIKYYDAIILASVDLHSFVIQQAQSVFDKYTEVQYDERGNIISMVEKENQNLYDRSLFPDTEEEVEVGEEVIEKGVKVGKIEIGDSLVQVGNIVSTSGRQNSIYLTSTDDQGPYINILSDLNRPDYSVLYKIPIVGEDGKYKTKKDEEGNFLEYEFEYTKTTKVRIGNLAGIVDYTFPADKQPRGFGLYGQNVYLTGDFYLNNGKSVIDASQDGIILKYKRAGLELVDMWEKDSNGDYILDEKGNKIPIMLEDEEGNVVKDDNGNPVQKQVISLTADEIVLNAAKTYIGDKTGGSMFEVIDGKAYIRTDFIRAQEIRVEQIYNYTFENELKPLHIQQYSYTKPTPVTIPSSGLNQPLNPPYDAARDTWVTTMSDGSGVFSDSTLYPAATGFFDCLNGDQVHIMSPVVQLKKGNADGKVVNIRCNFLIGDYTITESLPKIWAYSIDSKIRYDIPYTEEGSGRGTYKFVLNNIESDVATNNLIFGVSVVPNSANEVIQPFTDIIINIEYVEGHLNWALWKDGSGSLGRESIKWNKEGDLEMTGTFRTNRNGKTITLEYDKANNNPYVLLSDESNFEIAKLTYGRERYQTNDGEAYINSGILKLAATQDIYTSISANSINIKYTQSDATAQSTFQFDRVVFSIDRYLDLSTDKIYHASSGMNSAGIFMGLTNTALIGFGPPLESPTIWYSQDVTGDYPSISISASRGIQFTKMRMVTQYDEVGNGIGYHWKLTSSKIIQGFPRSGTRVGEIYTDENGLLRVNTSGGF